MTSGLPTINEMHLELLHQMFASATHDASAVMCRWTNGLITLSLDEVRDIAIEDIYGESGLGSDVLTMVVLTLDGEIGGTLILTFDETNGRKLASTLIGKELETDVPWNDLEKSALNETGNILGCAYMNALTRLINIELVPSPPYFIQDYGASVLEQAIMEQAATSDKVLICRTRFHQEGNTLDWNVFFIPTPSLREAIDISLLSDK